MFVSLYPLFAWLSTAELKLVPCVAPIDLCRQLIKIKGICVAQLIINSKYYALNKQRVCKKKEQRKKKKKKRTSLNQAKRGGGGREKKKRGDETK